MHNCSCLNSTARSFSPGEKFIISLNPDALPFYPLSHQTCNIRRPNSPTLNPTMEKSFKLNPEAKVFIPKEAHILVPPLYPRQPSHDISVNNDIIENAGLQPSISTSNNDNCPSGESAYSLLQILRAKNWKRIIMGTLNVNSIRNKILLLADLVIGKLDTLLLCGNKINNTFPTSQFLISGYSSPYRPDRSIHGGGLSSVCKK